MIRATSNLIMANRNTPFYKNETSLSGVMNTIPIDLNGFTWLARTVNYLTEYCENISSELKADVANFFNAIDRHIMFDLIQKRVHEDWLLKLIRQAALHDPRTNYKPHAPRHMFEKVPRAKHIDIVKEDATPVLIFTRPVFSLTISIF